MDKALNKVIKSHMTLTVLSVVAVVLLMGGVSYSIFQIDRKNTTNQKIQVGTLDPSITSIEGGIVVSDLYPESSSSITDDTKRYTFTIANNGTYNISYEVYLKDATDTLLASTTEYNEYKRIASDHYQYINYKLDGTTVKNLTEKQSGEKFVILKGTLKAGESEEHYLQFFLDNKETTTTGAPNEIAGSMISLDIYFDGEIASTFTNKMMRLSKGNAEGYADLAPSINEYKESGFSNETTYSMTSQGDRYFTYAESYTFNTITGKYTLTNPQVCQYSTCYAELTGKYITNYYGSTSSNGFSPNNLSRIYKVGTSTTETTLYASYNDIRIANYDNSADGIYEMEDDYGTSYYYRGAVENNYVKFGQNASGQDMYWRIIRLNGDGSLRMIYDGTNAHANGEASEDRLITLNTVFNSEPSNRAAAGYMIEDVTNSAIKDTLDAWYVENIANTGYERYVSDTLFCNDRTYMSGNIFGAYQRLFRGKNPTLKCPQVSDAFTVNDEEKGNGLLEYPVGTITADEVAVAGGRHNRSMLDMNTAYYLYKGYDYWTLSPYHYYPVVSDIFFVDSSGRLAFHNDGPDGAGTEEGVAPVINLKPEYVNKLAGDGTMAFPYHIE